MPTKKKTTTMKQAVVKKKPAAKKKTARSRAKVQPVMAKLDMPEPEPEPAPSPEPMPSPDAGSGALDCKDCGHLPLSANAVVGMLALVILVLSVVVLASVMTISSQAFQIDVFNQHGSILDLFVRN